jgi:hypothetical protein
MASPHSTASVVFRPIEPIDESKLDPKDVAFRRAMAECEPDRQALTRELTPMFQDLWRGALESLETILPQFRDEGSADFKLHVALRSRILKLGNDQVRKLPEVLKNYAVRQVYERQVTQRVKFSNVPILPQGIEPE